MKLISVLLFPFTLLYGLAVALRLWLYNIGFLGRTTFDIPIICIGNISAGGTGKTPHISWLIEQLKHQYRLAILSRGYGRNTVGYLAASANTTAAQLGDEPTWLYQTHRVPTVVCENRVLGVPNLLRDFPDTECILMDDGFQHLAIKPGYNILLTDYEHRFVNDWLLPSGRLREFKSGYKRADIIIVTKCPANISATERAQITEEINPLAHQRVLFSWIAYQPLIDWDGNTQRLRKEDSIILVTGIANAKPLVNELSTNYTLLQHEEYADHKEFTETHVREWIRIASSAPIETKIVCTQKDWIKLKPFEVLLREKLLIAPIDIEMNAQDKEIILTLVNDYISQSLAQWQ